MANITDNNNASKQDRPSSYERMKTRAELHKELEELLQAASKTSGTLPAIASGDVALGNRDASVSFEFRRSQERQKSSEQLPTTSKKSSELLSVVQSSRIPAVTTPATSNGKHTVGSRGSDAASHHMDMHSISIDSTAAKPAATYEGPTDLAGGQGKNSDRRSRRCPCLPWLPLKAIGAALKQNPSIWITSVLVMLLLATAGIIGVVLTAANETAQRMLAAEGFAINAGVAFERQLAQMFGPLLALESIIQFAPEYQQVNATFNATARKLLDQAVPVCRVRRPALVSLPSMHTLALVAQLPSAMHYPVVLGEVTPWLQHYQGRVAVAQQLLGYYGVVGRLPIFISPAAPNETWGAPDGPAYNCTPCYDASTQTRFWGFVNAVINLESMLNGSDSRLSDLAAMGYLYEMYHTNSKTGKLEQIAVSHRAPWSPVSTLVHVPGSNWTLQVSPEHGWVPVWRAPILVVVVLISCLFGLLLGAILVSSKLQRWLQSANDALAAEKTRMDVLLARQYNLISCVLAQEGDEGRQGSSSIENRTLARIEDMRREIGVSNGASGVDELQLLELMDEGSYGKVFKGLWRGSTVAVKTMVLPAKMSGAEKRERMAIMEAAISSAMNHPNIVQTYTYIIKQCSSSVGVAASSEGGSSSLLAAADLISGQQHLDTPEAHAPTVHNFEVLQTAAV
eukprot:gene3854-4111_t